MKLKHIILTAIRGLKSQLTRSALTILGIVIGIAAIIIIMSLGEGAQKLIIDQVSGLGPETVTLRPGKDDTDITSALYAQSLTKNDVEALKRKQNVPNLASISPSLVVSDPIEYRGDAFRAMVIGGNVEFFAEVLNIVVADGDLYTREDIEQQARVIVIGDTLKTDIFGHERAVGEFVQIKGHQFKIVGVFADSPTVGALEINKIAFLPYTSAQTYITGTNYYNELMIRADSPENVEKMAYDITLTMRDQHDIDFDEDDDFNVQTQEDVIARIETIINVFTAFLVAVVAISLVVGGIGIMNIMLVSVSERTKEIGLRKALGARSKDILRQFLTEAIILTGIGGVIGIVVGTAVSALAAVVLAQTVAENWTFTFPILGAVLGVGVSVAVGLIFGIYPANEASKKSPIEALRYE
ncbi:MAG: ABC transporter permease [Candidatus Kaiserbacteria bacterium]|nr:ABC transporter permease [Candidatus Kaiserbacteria bacterium]